MRMPRFGCAVMILTVLSSDQALSGFADELFAGYEVSVPYSGPIRFQFDRESSTIIKGNELDLSKPNSKWTFGLTPREFLKKVTPDLVLEPSSQVYISWLQAGNQAMGSVAPIGESGFSDQTLGTPLFFSDGNVFRSIQTSPSLTFENYMGNGGWNLNEKGQFLFKANGATFLYDLETDKKTALPSLGLGADEHFFALGIDNEGTVVGDATAINAQGKFITHAFRYSNGVMTDLNDLVMLNDELVLVTALDLTETGEIIARMANTWSGQEDWVKLTPAMVPETSSLLIGLAGIAAAAWKFRKHRASVEN